MSSYYPEVLKYEMAQSAVITACLAFSLSVIVGWFLLPVMIPNQFHKAGRIGYIVLCAVLYLFLAGWFIANVG